MRTGKLYRRITQCEWEHDVDITIFFTLRKINTYITSYYTSEIYDAIFYNAFSPRVQPEMWSADISCKIEGCSFFHLFGKRSGGK